MWRRADHSSAEIKSSRIANFVRPGQAVGAELLHQVLAVDAHARRGHAESRRDVLGRMTFDEHLEHLAHARRGPLGGGSCETKHIIAGT